METCCVKVTDCGLLFSMLTSREESMTFCFIALCPALLCFTCVSLDSTSLCLLMSVNFRLEYLL
ncbi:hypothetical protein JOB18_006180 [Solea senegalensis]|uniref:Uncharacterized protein n=1 Tax=Solea senegalensis TaxID=28829 RepID=A0AAV6R515_SOLSE|nr:hypothetical protein JOB18_006180 [Solea senegalensis]